jgi:hypothetical protein
MTKFIDDVGELDLILTSWANGSNPDLRITQFFNDPISSLTVVQTPKGGSVTNFYIPIIDPEVYWSIGLATHDYPIEPSKFELWAPPSSSFGFPIGTR